MQQTSKMLSMEKLTELAKLRLSENEQTIDTSYLENILLLAEKISAINTDHVSPATHAFDAIQPLREDAVTECNQRDSYQVIAPKIKEGLYLVPPVIE